MWAAAGGLAALTLLCTYPLSLSPADHLLASDPDAYLFMWTLSWDTHAFTQQPLALFDANIYHPQRHTLAYSENLIGSALVAAPVLWLTANPVLAHNVVALLSCVLCGLGAYALGRRLGMGFAAALLCGVVFAFAPPRFFRTPQLHLATVQWVPFMLASLHAYLEHGRRRDLRLAVMWFALQVVTSGHGAVFAGVAGGGLVAWRVLCGEPLAIGTRVRDVGVPGALLLSPLAIFLPYLTVQAEMGLRRPLENWGVPATSFLASPTWLHAYLQSFFPFGPVNDNASAFLFPGYLPIALAVAGLILAARAGPGHATPVSATTHRWTRASTILEAVAVASLVLGVWILVNGPVKLTIGGAVVFTARSAARALLIFALAGGLRLALALARRAPIAVAARARRLAAGLARWRRAARLDPTPFYAGLTLVCVLLAAGPPVGLWPFVYWLPGLNFIRVPSRFMVLAMLGLAVLCGLAIERIRATRAPARATRLAWAVGALLVAEFAAFPLTVVPYRVEIPALDRWLVTQPTPFVVAEVPVRPSERYQTTYMLHSMAHWQKTVHGYSGIRPPLHEDLYTQLRTFPDERSLRSLQDLGVTYVVVHADMYSAEEWAAYQQRLPAFQSRLGLAHQDSGGAVYRLLPAP